jgi:DNA-binding SARP family transcriptional activator
VPPIKLYLFGAPRLERDGKPVEIDTRKAIALLAYLTLTGGWHGRDSLAALLWPDYDQTRARAALRRTLSVLNKALGPHILDITRESIAVFPSKNSNRSKNSNQSKRSNESTQSNQSSEFWCDVWEFNGLLKVDRADPAAEDDLLPRLESAVGLYRDEFMAGFSLRDSVTFDDWQYYQAESLRTSLANSLESLCWAHGNTGNYDLALAYAKRWLSLDPLREAAHCQLMQLYAWTGQRNAALRQYQDCVRILDQELGVTPLEETTQLFQAIRDNRLKKPPRQSPPRQPQIPGLLNTPEIEKSATAMYPLVGRDSEWETLRIAYHASRPHGRICFLEGEAGIGKTRLAEEFLAFVRQSGARTFLARCYEGETDLAYGPFLSGFQGLLNYSRPGREPQDQDWLHEIPRHWLSEASRLLPEINSLVPDLPISTPLDGPGAQVRFYEGLRQVLRGALAGDPPGVLFVDDLHWADAASLDLLTYLSRRLSDMPIFILATARDDLSQGRERLGHLHAEAVRTAGGECFHLNRLSPSDTAELLRSVELPPPRVDGQSSSIITNSSSLILHSSISDRLYQESEGLPLIAVQYLQVLTQGGVQLLESAWATPGSVQVVLRSRLVDLDDTACQLLTTAAAIGRSFDFMTLKNASGRSEAETVGGLEALLARGLIRERVESDNQVDAYFDFTHEKLRQIVYEDTSLTRRRLLHRRIAEAFTPTLQVGPSGARGETFTPTRRMEPSEARGELALIAHHFHLAGQDDQAAQYFKLAGEHARTLYANREAIAHFQAAQAAGGADQTGLHEAIADLQTLNGEYRQAIANYAAAASLLPPGPVPASQAVRLYHKLGDLFHRLGDSEQAERYFESALEAFERGTQASDQPESEILDQSGSETDRRSVGAAGARLFTDWSRAAHNRRDEARALNLAQKALDLAEFSQDQLALAQSHNVLGMLARGRGESSVSIDHLERSLRVAEKIAEPGARIAALNNLALVEASLGQHDEAIAYTQTALDLCLRIGDRHREAALRNNLADLYHTLGQADEAMSQLKQAVVIFAEIGSITDHLYLEDHPSPAVWMLTEW